MNPLGDDIPTAESSVLAAVITSRGEALDDLNLIGDDFESPWHEELYDYMIEARLQGMVIDHVMLIERFPSRAPEIWSLTNHYPAPGVHEHHAEIIAAHGLVRRLKAVAAGLLQLNPASGVGPIMERAQSLVDGASGRQATKVRTMDDGYTDLEEQLRGGTIFHPTQWPQLNRIIGGLRPGALYVIGARPGVGKSVVATQLATEMAKYGQVSFSSLEMSETEIVSRIISAELGIYVTKLKNADLTLRDWDILGRNRHVVTDLPIFIDDRSSVQPADIRQHARAVSRKGELSCIVIDYLQLMSSSSKADRHVVVSEFTRQMKVMAKDLNVPVVLLSQLNRMSEQRGPDAMPRLSELRESGSIEQDADVVILLSRPEGTEDIIFDVAKNRHGATGVITLEWQGYVSRVVDPASRVEEPVKEEARGSSPVEGTEIPF